MADETDVWLANLEGAFENFDREDTDVIRCKDPVRVPRIPYSSLSAHEFYERFSKTNTPIILGDAWDAIPAHLDLNYWRENHSDALVPLDLGTSSERLVKLGDYIKFDDKELSRGYCRSLHTQEWFPAENATIQFPSVLGKNHLLEGGKNYPEAWSSWFELFISNKDSPGFPFLHKDMCATHALSMQIQGIKRFVLFPPSDTGFLYAYGNTQTRSAVPHADIVNFKVDLQQFPLYANANIHIADLRAGDVFFCPSNWWHTTTVVSAEPSVTLGGNYVDDANKQEFDSCWKEYCDAQKLVAAGITKIEHGGKRRDPYSQRSSCASSSTTSPRLRQTL